MSRKNTTDAIHDIIEEQKLSIPDIILVLSQVMTDIGMTIRKHKFDSSDQTSLTVDNLKEIEKEYMESPSIDGALILTASNMIIWADSLNKK